MNSQDVTTVFQHGVPPMFWGGLADFPRLPSARSGETQEDLEAEETSDLSSEGRDR